jgi:rhomboid protease GluP
LNEKENNYNIEGIRDIGRINMLLIAANAAVFIIFNIIGRTNDPEFMLYHGAVFTPMVLKQGAWYTLFTSMFLHFDISHIANNMIMLAAAGSYVEREMGSIRYLITYLLAGLGGNILSLYVDLQTMEYAVSAGASGAVFGVTGALLALALKNRGRVQGLGAPRIIIMIALSLYSGFTSIGVDNWAHVGGLVCGFVIAFLISPRKKPEQITVYDE